MIQKQIGAEIAHQCINAEIIFRPIRSGNSQDPEEKSDKGLIPKGKDGSFVIELKTQLEYRRQF